MPLVRDRLLADEPTDPVWLAYYPDGSLAEGSPGFFSCSPDCWSVVSRLRGMSSTSKRTGSRSSSARFDRPVAATAARDMKGEMKCR